MLRIIIFLFVYLTIGCIESEAYGFCGLAEILLWPVTVPLVWYRYAGEPEEQDGTDTQEEQKGPKH